METDISQWAVGLLRCWARLLLTSVIFSVLYWLKKTRDSVRRRPPVSCQPPKIFTDQYWPVKNAIMEHLELEDLFNLKKAYPSLQLQMWEEKQRRNKFLHEVTEFESNIEFSCCFLGHGCCSHYAHPIFTTIGCGNTEWKNSRMEELKEMISKLGPDINKIPRVKPKIDGSMAQDERCDCGWCGTLQNTKLVCRLEGITPLMYCALLDDDASARLLVENGSDIYQTGGPFQENCLHTAARLNSLYVTQYLIEELKMDKTRLDGSGRTALDVADENNDRMEDPDSILAQNAHEVLQLLTD